MSYDKTDHEKLRAQIRAGLRAEQAQLDAVQRASEPSAAWWTGRIIWLLVLKAAVLGKLLHWWIGQQP